MHSSTHWVTGMWQPQTLTLCTLTHLAHVARLVGGGSLAGWPCKSTEPSRCILVLNEFLSGKMAKSGAVRSKLCLGNARDAGDTQGRECTVARSSGSRGKP